MPTKQQETRPTKPKARKPDPEVEGFVNRMGGLQAKCVCGGTLAKHYADFQPGRSSCSHCDDCRGFRPC